MKKFSDMEKIKSTVVTLLRVEISATEFSPKPYRMTFLKFTMDYLSSENFSTLLSNAWTTSLKNGLENDLTHPRQHL